MGRQIIELVQVLVDRIYQDGYQQRCREDDIADVYKRLNEAEGQAKHWKQARQEAHEAGELMQAEIETLRGAMAADDQRLRDAEERVWPGVTWGCDAFEKMADEILHLRQQLADAQRAVSDSFAEVNSVRQQFGAANAAETLQRTRIERQRRVVDKVRQMLFKPNRDIEYGDINGLRAALAEFEAGTEPAPVAEPLDAEGGA